MVVKHVESRSAIGVEPARDVLHGQYALLSVDRPLTTSHVLLAA